jgi:hypothetical protein
VSESGGAVRELSGDVVCFETRIGGQYRVMPAGQAAPQKVGIHFAPDAGALPTSYRFTLSNGRIVQGRLGRPN